MGRCAVALVLLVALIAPAARADEESLRKRIQELEEQQKIFNEQLRQLREELDRERAQPAAAPATAPAPAPAVVAPAVPAPPAAPAAAQAPAPAPAPVEAAQPERIE